jgi:hypothetical protein
MNVSASFSCDRFLSLAGSELVSYVEPFVTTQSAAIPESVYESLQPKLPVLDNEHTVYALEICMMLKPSVFISHVVGFLSHNDSSVCCAAYRLIKSTKPSLMPADLAAAIAKTPTVDLFASDVRSGNRIRIGTNEGFIRDLVESFASKVDKVP